MKIIKNITSEGITYTDESGKDCFVDFKKCNENWIQYMKRTQKLNDINPNKNDMCVGQRDICADPKFIEFFTDPKFTKFEFKESNEYPNQEELFTKVQHSIISAGWTTLDLS